MRTSNGAAGQISQPLFAGKVVGPRTANSYIATMIVSGALATLFAFPPWRSEDPTRFTIFLTLFRAAVTLKCCSAGVAAGVLVGAARLPYLSGYQKS
jgi:hypothetical protein